MKKPTEAQVKSAKAILKHAGYIQSFWHIDDIISRDAENVEWYKNSKTSSASYRKLLTSSEARNVVISLEDNLDANEGINWDVLDIHIDAIKDARNAK